ncbi:hypothetical protein Trydic_g21857 [Trypoxylus dichotomus]
MCKIVLTLIASIVILNGVDGHGMMTSPPGRSSVWRFFSGFPANYNDNANYCGGLWRMVENNGNCGLCGDDYTSPHPQANENTGKYGLGKVVGQYSAGQIIDVSITLTANHRGEFLYSLCVLDNPNAPETGEDCFVPLKLADGSDRYMVSSGENNIVNRVALPATLTCERCVLRWHYKAGNSWGVCEDGTSAMGCGYQETFRSCADISIS